MCTVDMSIGSEKNMISNDTSAKNFKRKFNHTLIPAYINGCYDDVAAKKDTFVLMHTENCFELRARNHSFIEELKWDKNDIDSIFTFGILTDTIGKGLSNTVDIEIWYKLSPEKFYRISQDLYYTLSTKYIAPKVVPGTWDWFEYRNRFFFVYYMSGVRAGDLQVLFTPNFKKDSTLLDYSLFRLEKALKYQTQKNE